MPVNTIVLTASRSKLDINPSHCFLCSANVADPISRRQGLSGPNNRPNGTGSPNSVNGNGDQTPPANSNSRFPVGMTQAMGQGVGSNSAYSDQSYNTSNTSVGVASNQAPPAQTVRDEPKVFFNPKYAKLGVKGNFMPLSAIPELVRPGEWLAHQCKSSLRLADPRYLL